MFFYDKENYWTEVIIIYLAKILQHLHKIFGNIYNWTRQFKCESFTYGSYIYNISMSMHYVFTRSISSSLLSPVIKKIIYIYKWNFSNAVSMTITKLYRKFHTFIFYRFLQGDRTLKIRYFGTHSLICNFLM